MAGMDNLTRDVLAAQAAGYGPWYGRYIADHGHTPSDEPKPVTVHREMAVCPFCGAQFVQKEKWPKKYCGAICQERARAQQKKLSKEKRRRELMADCAASPE